MARFTFSLESVLSLRIRAEQQCQRDVAASQRRFADLESQLRDVSRESALSTEQIRAHLRGVSPDPSALATHARYHQFLSKQCNDLHTQILAARAMLDEAKASLQSAISQRKSLEKLRERQHEQWLAAQHKHERRTHDDLAARI